jgi:hypothetical protein
MKEVHFVSTVLNFVSKMAIFFLSSLFILVLIVFGTNEFWVLGEDVFLRKHALTLLLISCIFFTITEPIVYLTKERK